MGHIYLSHSHPTAIYACPISSQPMGRFPWDSHRNDIPMDKPAYNPTLYFTKILLFTLLLKNVP